VAELLALLALAVSVVVGATISPRRRFSWAMYSASTKAFLWVREPQGPRLARPQDLCLAPENHLLTLPDFARVLAGTEPAHPIEGLIIGYTGNHVVRYDPRRPTQLARARLAAGTELDELAETLHRLPPCR
jgi:hypothetical protein